MNTPPSMTPIHTPPTNPTQFARAFIQGKYDDRATDKVIGDIQTILLKPKFHHPLTSQLATGVASKLEQRAFKKQTIGILLVLSFLVLPLFIGCWMMWQNQRIHQVAANILALNKKTSQLPPSHHAPSSNFIAINTAAAPSTLPLNKSPQLLAFYSAMDTILPNPVCNFYHKTIAPLVHSMSDLKHARERIEHWIQAAIKDSKIKPSEGYALISQLSKLIPMALPTTPSTIHPTPLWKGVPRLPQPGFIPDFFQTQPPLNIYPDYVWLPFCTPEFLTPFDAKAHNFTIPQAKPSARLNGATPAIQFYREQELPDTALFGNFEYCPCGLRIMLDNKSRSFHNAESAFQAVKLHYLLQSHAISKIEHDKLLDALLNAQSGDDAWPTIKQINAYLTPTLAQSWGSMSPSIMLSIVRAKFSQDPVFAAALLSQKGKYLIENSGNMTGNWSISPVKNYAGGAQGRNWLGNVLMEAMNDPLVVAAAAMSPLPASAFSC